MAIIMIEGPRCVGKTHLLDSFFRQNTNPNVFYYKFAFAKYIEELGMRDQESGPGVHYFSIANVMTILELNREFFKDRVVIFDRSIFSAYVWSIYRERMEKPRLLGEFEKILASDLYRECTIFYLNRGEEIEPEKRKKDYFGNFENYSAERQLFEEINLKFKTYTNDPEKGTVFRHFVNRFDESSITEFCQQLNDLSLTALSINK